VDNRKRGAARLTVSLLMAEASEVIGIIELIKKLKYLGFR
jgi:hypothetical protein